MHIFPQKTHPSETGNLFPDAKEIEWNEHELSARFSGKLLLREEIPLDEATFQKLVYARYFKETESIARVNFGYQCQRCSNKKRHLFGEMPCHTCKKTHIYCRKCIEMGRISECSPLYYWTGPEAKWTIHVDPCSWNGKLTFEQQRAANRVIEALERKEKELLIWAVCGAGKTEMLFPGITEALRQGKRICLATPRADVVRELLPRFSSAFSEIRIQGLYGGSEDNDGTAQMIIATTHQLLRYQAAFDLMIIDEIDAFPFHKDPSLPFAANRAKKREAVTIYLTATPRQNQRTQIASKKLPHIFVPIRFHGHPLPVPVLKSSFSLQKYVSKHMPPPTFITWLNKRKNPERQLLIFVPSITLAEGMKTNLADKLLAGGYISSKDVLLSVHAKDTNREGKIQAFREKKISVLLTTTILERGVTFPSVDVAILDAGHDVFDEAALVQIAGRAGRSPDDPAGEVMFFHDGKTDAMVQAVHSIIAMNRRGGNN